MRKVVLFVVAMAGVAALLGVAGCSSSGPVGPVFSTVPSTSIQAQAKLITPQSEVLIGQYITLSVHFTNTGPARWFYNPSFDPSIPAPAVLAIYSPRHKYLGNLLPANPSAIPTPEAWVLVPAGGTVDAKIDVPTDYFPGKPGMRLKPATYTLQLVYSVAFTSKQPAPDMLDGSAFHTQLRELELMRSNAIAVQLTPLVPK